MKKIRLIARLDVKGQNLIKGVNLEGLRVIGDPQAFAKKYYEEGIDEILYMDAVASLYGRNNLKEVVEHTSREVFIPMSVGGGIRSLKDVEALLNSGADKIAINTAAISEPELIATIANRFGSQCVVVSIEAKKQTAEFWEAYTDNGRETTGISVMDWVKRIEDYGAGEILLTSVDNEGTRRGFDVDLVKMVTDIVSVPVVASGGYGKAEDIVDVVTKGNADAVAIADAFHYGRESIGSLKASLRESGIEVRKH